MAEHSRSTAAASPQPSAAGARAEAHPPTHEEEIHLPSPTLAPATVGLGVMLLTFGILFGIALVVAGALFMLLGIAVWLINDAREFERTGEHGGHH